MAKLSQEAAMIERIFFSHYRGIIDVSTTLIALGAALLLGQIILWARL
jgi:hypothetical protein